MTDEMSLQFEPGQLMSCLINDNFEVERQEATETMHTITPCVIQRLHKRHFIRKVLNCISAP